MIALARQMWRQHLGGYLAVVLVVAGGAAVTSAVTTVLVAAASGSGLAGLPAVEAQQAAVAAEEMTMPLLGISLGIAVFTACFLTSSAMMFALDARQRETGLLRLLGATPRQLAGLYRAESALLGVVGGALGAALGWPGASGLQAMLARVELSDPRLQVSFSWPATVTSVAGAVLCAVLGAWGPARRAGRDEPVLALALPGGARRTMTVARWVLAVVGVGSALAMLAVPVTPGASIDGPIGLAIGTSLLLIVGLTALAPLLVPVTARLLGAAVQRVAPAVGLLAAADARVHARRTAALAAPILLVVGLYAGLGTLSTTTRAIPDPAGTPVPAALVVTGADGAVRSQSTACSAVDGVAACSATARLPGRWRTGEVSGTDGRVVEPESAAAVLGVRMASGEMGAVGGDVAGVSEYVAGRSEAAGTLTYTDAGGREHEVGVGPVVVALEPYWAPDLLLSFDQLAAWGAPEPAGVEVWVALHPGADPEAVARDLAAALGGATVRTTEQWQADADAADEALNRNALIALFGAAEVLALVAVAVTSASSARERRGQYALLCRTGAARRQVLGAALVEVGLVTAVAAALVLGVQAVLVVRIGQILPGVAVVTPWGELAALFGAAVAVAALTTAAATWQQVRRTT